MEYLPTRSLSIQSASLAIDEFLHITRNLSHPTNVIEEGSIDEEDSDVKSSSESILKLVGNLNRNSLNEEKPSDENLLEFSDLEDKTRNKRESSEILVENTADGSLPKDIVKEVIELNEFETVKPEGSLAFEVSQLERLSVLDRRDVCRAKTCLDDKFNLPPIYKTSSQNLAWDIKGLGNPQDSGQKSTSIKKVNKKRKEKHEYTIKEIDLRMNDVNDIIEHKIRKEAENLVSCIKMVKENVERIISSLKDKPFGNSNRELIKRMQEIIKQLNDNRLGKIDSFCDFVEKLEKERSEAFKVILKNAYADIHDNMYLMPFEIQCFFEKKVQHLNEVTINNYHCYAELQRKLKTQMEEEMRLWFQALKYHELLPKDQGGLAENPQELSETKSAEKFEGPTKQDIINKLKKAEENFLHLKIMSKKSIFLQCETTIEIFEHYLTGLERAADALFRARLIDNDGIKLDSEDIRRIAKKNYIEDEEIQKLWFRDVQTMVKMLESNFKTFSYSTHLFDCYFYRFEELMKLYDQKLFLLMAKHNKQIAPRNIAMNILIDTLRQDVSEESLNHTLQLIQENITSIENSIQENLKEEIALVDRFLLLGIACVDVLLEELRRFVVQFVPNTDSDPRQMRGRASWMNMMDNHTTDHLFPMYFWQCRYMIQGINNWQFGVWNAFTTAMESCKKIVASILTDWADREKDKLTRRSKLKNTMNNVRIHSIREDIWKVRLAELKIHEERVVQHDLAVRKMISESSKLKLEMMEQCERFLKTECDRRINEIMKEFKSIRRQSQAVVLVNRLKSTNSEIVSSMKESHEKLKNEYYTTLKKIAVSHIGFMKSIKLFSEDGNFKTVEAKAMMKKITALEKILSKELSNSEKKIDDIFRKFEEKCERKFEEPSIDAYKLTKEFSFKDEMERKMKKFNQEISRGLFDINFEIRKLNSKLRSWYEASYRKENLGDYEFLQTFTRCYKELLSEISDMGQKLQYNDSLAPNVSLLKQKVEVSQISLMSTIGSRVKKNVDSRSTISMTNDKKIRHPNKLPTTIKTKNHSPMLYDVAPVDDGKFISGLHQKVHKSFCGVRESAKIFYRLHGNILDTESLPSDLRNFIGGILNKYKHFKMQIECAWLEVAIDFCELVANFLKFIRNVHRDSLRKFSENRLESLTEECTAVVDSLEANLRAVENNYFFIHNKLKPMFGHPENAEFLATIKNYVEQAHSFNEKTLLEKLEPSKDSIKQHCIATESFFLDMEKILSCVRNSTTVLNLHKEFEDKVIERIEVVEKIVSSESCDLDASNQTYFDIGFIDLKKIIQDYKSRISLPSDCGIPFSKNLQNTTTSTESATSVDTEEMIKINFNLYEKTAEKIDNLKTKCSETEDKYQKIWEQGIERISDLYTIKYDFPVPD